MKREMLKLAEVGIASVMLSLSSGALAAPAYTNEIRETRASVQSPVVKTTLNWYSPTNHNFLSGTTVAYFRGQVERVVFVPTDDTLTNIYSVTMVDENGVDILGGLGTSLSNAVVEIVPAMWVSYDTTNYLSYLRNVNDQLVVAITNCGRTNAASIAVYTK